MSSPKLSVCRAASRTFSQTMGRCRSFDHMAGLGMLGKVLLGF